MFRLIVLLLMLPSLLMPPGVCICQFVPLRETRASSSPVGLPVPSEHTKRAHSECTCAACRSHLDVDQADLLHGLPRSEPSPIDEHGHWPGCPAAINAVAHTLPLPVTTVPADVCSPPAVFTGVEPALIQPMLIKDRAATAQSPPIFLANCSLLI
ncbi:MAG: hypothetical protein U0791_06145 [Gemmataceae bacterium]